MRQLFFTAGLSISLVLSVGCVPFSSSENEGASQAQMALGLAYLEQHDFVQAKRQLLAATRSAQHSAVAWDALAYYWEQTGEASLAEHYYRKALALNPREAAIHNNYGVFLCRQTRYTEAIQHFLQAAHDPEYLNPAKAYHNAAFCAQQQEKGALASLYERKAYNYSR